MTDVFLSWSGTRSEAVAHALFEWIPLVLQPVKPWISREIEKGSRWEDTISERLEVANFGIICLTPENLRSEWLLFEAGALSKKAREARVCTYLYGLKEGDVAGPLAKFQHTRADLADTKLLVEALNRHLGAAALDRQRLDQTFDHWWPELDRLLRQVSEIAYIEMPKRNPADKLDEILVEVRALRRIADEPRTSRNKATRAALRLLQDEAKQERRAWIEFRQRIAARLMQLDGVELLTERDGKSTAQDPSTFFDIFVKIGRRDVGIDVHVVAQFSHLVPFPEFASRHALQISKALRSNICHSVFIATDEDMSDYSPVRDLSALASELSISDRLKLVHGSPEAVAATIHASVMRESAGLTSG
jgi:hypothetical protein